MGFGYIRKQRRTDVTQQEMDAADAIRNKLTQIATRRGYGVKHYTDEHGRQLASVCRTDGRGVGFTITERQAAEWFAAAQVKQWKEGTQITEWLQ